MHLGIRHPSLRRRRPRLAIAPTTPRGRLAVVLALLAVVLTMTWSLVPSGGIFGFAAGVASGVLGALAIVRDRERAISVWLTLVPFVWVVVFVVAELVVGHD